MISKTFGVDQKKIWIPDLENSSFLTDFFYPFPNIEFATLACRVEYDVDARIMCIGW